MADENNKDMDQQNQEEHNKYEIKNWDDLLKFTRRSYLRTVEELTKIQERTENTVKSLIETGSSYSKESSNVIKDWADMVGDTVGKFQKNSQHLFTKATDRAAKELNINIPFQKEFQDLFSNVQKNIDSIFNKMQNSEDEKE